MAIPIVGASNHSNYFRYIADVKYEGVPAHPVPVPVRPAYAPAPPPPAYGPAPIRAIPVVGPHPF